jgi:hypothetical protein
MGIEEVKRKHEALTDRDQGLWGADMRVPDYIPADLRVMYWFAMGGDHSGPFSLSATDVLRLIERVGRAEAGIKP